MDFQADDRTLGLALLVAAEVLGLTSFPLSVTDLDENALHEISDKTKGQFFRAYDTGTIESAFAAIDKAQKIEFQAKSYLITSELFPWLAVPGVLLLLFGMYGWAIEPGTAED